VVNAKRDGVIVAGGHRLPELDQELKQPGSPTNRLLRAYFERHPELDASRPSHDDRYRMVFFLKMVEADRLAAPVENRWIAARDAQLSLVDALRVLSPASLLSATLVDISGTGRKRYNDFLAQVDRHRRTWMDWVIARYATTPLLDGSDYDTLPQFVYQEEPAPQLRRRVLTNVTVLAGVIALLAVCAVFRYLRYPIVG
jgi:hypothetical protein